MARILIVEEALKNRSGHWYEYNRAIVEELRRRGHNVTLLAHRNIEPDICAEIRAHPFFPVTSWDLVYNHPRTWRRYLGILKHNKLIAKLLQKHFKAQTDPYDVVLVPTTVLYHWLAWRWLVFRGAGKWFHRVVLTTRNNAGEYDPKSQTYTFTSSARVLASVLRTFRRPVEDGTVELASDSEVLCRQYLSLCGIPFHPYPHPRPTAHLPVPERRERKELVFSALGPPRYEKGSDLIVEAIGRVLLESPEFPGKFLIQWTDRVYSPDGIETILPPDWRNHPKIEVIYTSLSSEDYQERMDETDVILVPYRRRQYHARLSGVVIEAFQSGLACICVANTWLDDCRIKIGKGIAIQSEEASELAAVIQNTGWNSRNLSRLDARQIARARHAHSPQRFVEVLLQTDV